MPRDKHRYTSICEAIDEEFGDKVFVSIDADRDNGMDDVIVVDIEENDIVEDPQTTAEEVSKFITQHTNGELETRIGKFNDEPTVYHVYAMD
jgi:hypothetical protein